MPWYDRGKGIGYSNPKRPGRFKRAGIDTKALLEMYYEGKKIPKIAESFNVSIATIKRHLKFIVPESMKRNNGLTSNPNDPFNADVIRYYTNHHYSTGKIGEIMGCSSEKVRTRLKKCGIELRDVAYKNLLQMHPKRLNRKSGKDYPIPDLEEFNKCFKLMYCLNFERDEIAEFLNIHEQTVERRIKFLRLNYNFKLRVCKYCERFFRFIATDRHKTSNVCQLCLSELKNSGSIGIRDEVIAKIRKIDSNRRTNGVV